MPLHNAVPTITRVSLLERDAKKPPETRAALVVERLKLVLELLTSPESTL
jgi:hypothetical protein